MFLKRKMTGTISEALKQFPVVFLTGPRQSGKTTLIRQEFPGYHYTSLEDPGLRQWAIEDPGGFLYDHPSPLVIDEAQYAPVIFSYIQLAVDRENRPGMFLLSGSQNFMMMEKISQSLAGRTAVLSLLPLSYGELPAKEKAKDTNNLILKGFFPRLYNTVSDHALFYKSYLNTYVERDIRQLANIGNMNDFIRFMKLCAGRSGQLLNISSLATETGIAYNTCKNWLSFLETGYIIRLVSPHYANLKKRIIKSPKLYFTDTGLLSYLLGIDTVNTLVLHPFRGSLFENLIFIELQKLLMLQGLERNVWFWRDNHGTEVDFLVEEGGRLTAVEVKSGRTIHGPYLGNLKKYKKYNPAVDKSILFYDGDIERTMEGVRIVNWRKLPEVLE